MKRPLQNTRVLITCGPTWVALDDTRVISNLSSGEMGSILAGDFLKAGADVTVLEGPVTRALSLPGVAVKRFTFLEEFSRLFKHELKKKYAVVIHAAAVSDFRPRARFSKKIPSGSPLNLELIPTKKIIRQIKHIAPDSVLVGFKLESSPSETALRRHARALIAESASDYVVANCLKGGYHGYLFGRDGTRLAAASSRRLMSRRLISYLTARFARDEKTAGRMHS